MLKASFESVLYDVTNTKIKSWLTDKAKNIEQFHVDFPLLYQFYILPLEKYGNINFYKIILDLFFYKLFLFIDGKNSLFPFFHSIETTLNALIKSHPNNRASLIEKNNEIFRSSKTFDKLSEKSRGLLAELLSSRYLFATYGSNIKLEFLSGKGCDLQFFFEGTLYLCECKAKLPMFGCENNVSTVNAFLKNYIFALRYLLLYTIPEFYEKNKEKFYNFDGYEDFPYDQPLNFVRKIADHFSGETINFSKMKEEQEVKLLYVVIEELCNQILPCDSDGEVPSEDAQIANTIKRAQKLANMDFLRNTLSKATKQLNESAKRSDYKNTKKMAFVYLQKHKSIFYNSFNTEKAARAGLKEFYMLTRQIMDTNEDGREIDVYIMDDTVEKI